MNDEKKRWKLTDSGDPAEMSEETIKFQAFLGAASNLYTILDAQKRIAEKDRDRLFTLAVKWCEQGHHDWEELLAFDRRFNSTKTDS